MNERIRELANQLGHIATIGNWGRVEWADSVYPQLGDRLYAAIDLEEFAELIVRECARVAAQTPCPYDEDARKTFGHTWDMACVESARNIRKHFGVEE